MKRRVTFESIFCRSITERNTVIALNRLITMENKVLRSKSDSPSVLMFPSLSVIALNRLITMENKVDLCSNVVLTHHLLFCTSSYFPTLIHLFAVVQKSRAGQRHGLRGQTQGQGLVKVPAEILQVNPLLYSLLLCILQPTLEHTP